MPTVRQIEERLFALAPKEGAMSWDNVGLLVGDPEREVSRILVALDITERVTAEAEAMKAQLIVSHHPVMNCTWLPVQTLREDTPQGQLLRRLVRSGISAICMHTNLDVSAGGVNDVLAHTMKLVDPGPLSADGIGRVGTLSGGSMPLPEFIKLVSDVLHPNGIRYCSGGRDVFRVAVGGGACAEYMTQAAEAGCDTFVTADVKYHDFLNAAEMGLNLVDAGHFPTEDPVCSVLIDHLKSQFPSLTIEKSASHREVIQYYVKGE